MKKYTNTIIILVSFLILSTANAATFPEGKYVFSAPALFGNKDGKARGKLCELEKTEEGYRLVFLNNPLSPNSRITFSIKDDRIVFDESHMPSTEIGRTITGKGNLQDDTVASGKLTVNMGSVGFLLAKRKSSEWSLRPAKRSEVLDSYAEGLKMAEKLLWSRRSRQKPTRENAIKALYSVVGYGFTRKDIPELKRMLESGELKYEEGKFFFRRKSTNQTDFSGNGVSTNVYEERIDLRKKVNAAHSVTMQVVNVSPAESNVDSSEAEPQLQLSSNGQIESPPTKSNSAGKPQERDNRTLSPTIQWIAAIAFFSVLAVILTVIWKHKER